MVCWMAYNAYLFSVLSTKVTKYPFNDLDSLSKTDYRYLSASGFQALWDSQDFVSSDSASRNVFWQKKQIFSKNALFVLYFKEAKLSPAEWC